MATKRLVDSEVDDQVVLVVDGSILIIVLNRPQARNAVTAEITRGLEAALDELEGRSDLHAAVLAHEGPVFCAGADLKAVQRGEAGSLQTERGGFAGFVARSRSKPLVAAVDGPALAGGFEMVLNADLVVASTNAYFSLPEVRRGLIAAGGGLVRAMSQLPRNVGLELLLAGSAITAERAYHFGLVNRLVEPETAHDEAIALAREVVKGGPLALAATRRLALANSVQVEQALESRVVEELEALYASEDVAEALAAFFEKRDPVWSGR